MNSRREEHSGRDQGAGSERVFLVGVEFLSRGLTKRTHKKSADERDSRDDEESSSGDRRQSVGKVPPVARAARSVADTRLHATEVEHRAFSAEESLAELRELATSAGAVIAGEMQQRRQRPDSATLIGSGKVLELIPPA